MLFKQKENWAKAVLNILKKLLNKIILKLIMMKKIKNLL